MFDELARWAKKNCTNTNAFWAAFIQKLNFWANLYLKQGIERKEVVAAQSALEAEIVEQAETIDFVGWM